MNSNLKIKVCGVAGEDFIKIAGSLNIQFIGFIFYNRSKRYLMNNLYNKSIKLMPKHIKKVGVFVNETIEQIQKTVNAYKLDYVQLHGDENVNFTAELEKKYKLIKAFRIDKDFDFEQIRQFEKYCKYFLFDTKGQHYGGTGKKFNWEILKKYNGITPFLLSGGIEPKDVIAINNFTHPLFAGIDINSRFEVAPGMKNISLIQKFINEIK